MSEEDKETREQQDGTQEGQDTQNEKSYLTEDEFQERFDEHRREFHKRGERSLARKLGLNPDNVDLSSEESIMKALEERKDARENLDAERIERVKEEVRSEYEPYKQEAEQLRQRIAKSEVLSAAKQAGFVEDVTEGEWADDFVQDVLRRTEVHEDHGRVVVDENGQPVPSSEEGRTYKGVTDLVQELGENSRWRTFAGGQPQTADSGFSENESASPGKTAKSDFTEEERRAYITENGYSAWAKLPE